jgi:hypothetical protein
VGVEILSVDDVELVKIVHVSKEDVGFHSLFETGASILQDGFHVLDDLVSVVRDAALDSPTLWGIRGLTRDIDKVCDISYCSIEEFIGYYLGHARVVQVTGYLLLTLMAWEQEAAAGGNLVTNVS